MANEPNSKTFSLNIQNEPSASAGVAIGAVDAARGDVSQLQMYRDGSTHREVTQSQI